MMAVGGQGTGTVAVRRRRAPESAMKATSMHVCKINNICKCNDYITLSSLLGSILGTYKAGMGSTSPSKYAVYILRKPDEGESFFKA